jgi:hypothetical protein
VETFVSQATRENTVMEEEAPFQNTEKSGKNRNIVLGPIGARYKERLYWRGSATIYWTGLELLCRLRVAVLRSEKLTTEVGDSSGAQRKRNVRRWKPQPRNGW